MELLRLLAGSRWRLGVKDLLALGELSSVLAKRDIDQRALPDEVRETMRNSLADGERGSLVDALDFLATAKPDRSEWERFSADGVERLRDAGRTFARLRTRAGLDLPDFVAAVVQELQLDIEVAANRYRTLGPAPIEAFFDALERLPRDRRRREPRRLPRLAARGGEARRPLAAPRGSGARHRAGAHHPRLQGSRVGHRRRAPPGRGRTAVGAAEPQGLAVGRPAAVGVPRGCRRPPAARLARRRPPARSTSTPRRDFREAVRAHEGNEERRLAYVAVTRARDSLLLSGSFWGATKKKRMPSPFLLELAAAGVIGPLPAEPRERGEPARRRGRLRDAGRSTRSAGVDPRSKRRPSAVRAAPAAVAGPWSDEVALLLEERRRRLEGQAEVAMPTRVPASRFKEFLTDPASVAASLRRPMPERPYRATQLGTLFHAWVEDRYGAGDVTDELDALPVESDTEDFVGVDDAALAALKRTFEASPWAGRRPVEVEREIHLPFAGRIVICKIDAVYEQDGRFQVVDWKTGKAPKDAQDLEEKQLQLALYRLAYAHWRGIDPAIIDAVFYYVADDRMIAPGADLRRARAARALAGGVRLAQSHRHHAVLAGSGAPVAATLGACTGSSTTFRRGSRCRSSSSCSSGCRGSCCSGCARS